MGRGCRSIVAVFSWLTLYHLLTGGSLLSEYWFGVQLADDLPSTHGWVVHGSRSICSVFSWLTIYHLLTGGSWPILLAHHLGCGLRIVSAVGSHAAIIYMQFGGLGVRIWVRVSFGVSISSRVALQPQP